MSEETLFTDALEIADPADRAAFLDRTCAGDAALRERLNRLLEQHAQAGSFLGHPAPLPPNGPLDAPAIQSTRDIPAPPDGGVIGPYKLVEVVGEGGMGTVWLAQQQEPVKRLVALKVIKAGMDSKRVLARFEAERQALALMDHPNIARVFDAGSTADGRPFFIMELVKGVPITRYCDERRLTPRERLELFVLVCQAVQHAHQKGVIHRDIKPSNVLVALYDGRPVPKVIDFGIAKAAGQPLTEKTLVTGLGAVVGTPEYMSPEQAELNQLDIDTRSDVYSLGILLYELLTGTTPLQRKRVQQAALFEVLRLVREEEPPRPSTRLSTTDELPSIAANRGTEPKRLSGLVCGDLDWIVMKALEKDRGRRYETANGFALDVLRYLADEPVQACPPSAGYRLRKFARRNKGPALAAGVVLLALVGGIAGLAFGLVRADEQRRMAETSATAEMAAKDEAQRRLAQIEKGVELFAGLVSGLNPKSEEQGAPPLYEQLRARASKAADELIGEAVGDAEAVARLQRLLGVTLLELGDAGKAVDLLERARATREAKLGTDHLDTLATLSELALAYRDVGKLPEAVALSEQVRKTITKKLGADHAETLTVLDNLARVYSDAGKGPQAIALFEQVRDARVKKLGADHDETLTTMNNLAVAYHVAGRLPEAIALFEQVRRGWENKRPPDHSDILMVLNSLAVVYQDDGKLPEAIALLEQVRDARVKKLPPDHPATLTVLNNLALAYKAAGRMPEAIALIEQVRDSFMKKYGAEHPFTITTLNNLAIAYKAAGRLPEAIASCEQAAAGIEKLRFQHQYAGRILGNLIDAYKSAKQFDRAETWQRKWVAVVKEQAGADSTTYADQLVALGMLLLDQRKFPEAATSLNEGLAVREKAQPDFWTTFNTKSLLGGALLGQKKHAEAEPLLLAGYEGMKKREGTIPPQFKNLRLGEAVERLALLYDATNKPDEAARWRKELDSYRPKGSEPMK